MMQAFKIMKREDLREALAPLWWITKYRFIG